MRPAWLAAPPAAPVTATDDVIDALADDALDLALIPLRRYIEHPTEPYVAIPTDALDPRARRVIPATWREVGGAVMAGYADRYCLAPRVTAGTIHLCLLEIGHQEVHGWHRVASICCRPDRSDGVAPPVTSTAAADFAELVDPERRIDRRLTFAYSPDLDPLAGVARRHVMPPASPFEELVGGR